MEKLKIRSRMESKRAHQLATERTVLTTRLRDKEEELKGKAKLLEVGRIYEWINRPVHFI